MYQNYRHPSECARSLNRGVRAAVGCTKITDIWSDSARSKDMGAKAEVVCININDICQSALGL
jgi:hypothetical protein